MLQPDVGNPEKNLSHDYDRNYLGLEMRERTAVVLFCQAQRV